MRILRYSSCRFLWCFLLAFPSAVPARVTQLGCSADPRINKEKAIAYLTVDHIGSRDPIEPGEGNIGIYLQLHNNSRMPLVVAIVTNPHEKTSVPSLLDEVIPNPLVIKGEGVPWMPSPGFPTEGGMDNLQSYPNEDELGVRAAEFDAHRRLINPHGGKVTGRPSGYGWDLTPVLTLVQPGAELLFSMPLTHVSCGWHMEIPFRFGLADDGKVRPPYSYLAFYWKDLPRNYKTKGCDPVSRN